VLVYLYPEVKKDTLGAWQISVSYSFVSKVSLERMKEREKNGRKILEVKDQD